MKNGLNDTIFVFIKNIHTRRCFFPFIFFLFHRVFFSLQHCLSTKNKLSVSAYYSMHAKCTILNAFISNVLKIITISFFSSFNILPEPPPVREREREKKIGLNKNHSHIHLSIIFHTADLSLCILCGESLIGP